MAIVNLVFVDQASDGEFCIEHKYNVQVDIIWTNLERVIIFWRRLVTERINLEAFTDCEH